MASAMSLTVILYLFTFKIIIMTRALLFDIEVYDRAPLYAMKKNELLDLAMEGGDNTMVLYLEELQELINDDTINVNAWWTFFI